MIEALVLAGREWNHDCDVAFCGDRQAFWVEWAEDEGGYRGEYAGLYCNKHTSAMRAGWSPFEEWGSTPIIQLIRTAAEHRARCEQSRIQQ